MQYHIYKHLTLGLGAYKCDIALEALNKIYVLKFINDTTLYTVQNEPNCDGPE